MLRLQPNCPGNENGLRFGGGTASFPPFTARVCLVVASGVIAQLVERRVRNEVVYNVFSSSCNHKNTDVLIEYQFFYVLLKS